MIHQPQHPENPYLLPEQDQVPAKIWELLRRNDHFRRVVAGLKRLDDRARQADSPDRHRAWNASDCLVRHWEVRHRFAAIALQWLVPDPLFAVRRFRLSANLASPAPAAKVELDCYEEGEGTTADPSDSKDWRWASPSDFNRVKGRRRFRGPEVCRREYADPDLQSGLDELAEWQSYAWPFTVEHSWSRSPAGFRRAFHSAWIRCDTRATYRITGRHAPEADLVEVPAELCQNLQERIFDPLTSGSLSVKSLAEVLSFAAYIKGHRVFAVSSAVRTRTEARRISERLRVLLTTLPDGTELPSREKEELGTPLQWDMLLYYEQRRQQGEEHSAALRSTFDTLFLRLPTIRQHATKSAEPTLDNAARHVVAKAILGEAESTRWHSWVDDFQRMHSPLSGTGMVQSIFQPRTTDR